MTYQKFLSVTESLGLPETPLDAPTMLNEKAQTTLTSGYEVPQLEELKVDLSGLGKELFPGGETEAMKRLNKYMCKLVTGIIICNSA